MRPSSSSRIALASDLAATRELARDRGGRPLLARDRVLHGRLDAGGGAVLEHPPEHVLAVAGAR